MKGRESFAGWLLTTAVVGSVANMIWPQFPRAFIGACVWIAGILLWTQLRPATHKQVSILLLCGLAGILWGLTRSIAPDWAMLLSGNALLLSMLAAVSFLRLITRPDSDQDEQLPQGARAVPATLLGVHLFGAVINLSTVFIMADRINRGGLTPTQVKVLGRGFAAAAFWSPFFAAMAAALTYAPGAQVEQLWLIGIPLAAVALFYTLAENRNTQEFIGYPLHPSALALPGVLALAVVTLRYWQPEWSILGIICLLAPGITLIAVFVRSRAPVATLNRHITRDLPGMHNELALFLAAGVMATGLNSLFASAGGWLPFDSFGGFEASLTLVFMLLTSIAGVHPVINIAALGTLLMPLQPNGTLLAMTFLAAWGIGVASSPFSGMNLALQGRYGFAAVDSLRWNGLYSLTMTGAAILALNLYSSYMNIH